MNGDLNNIRDLISCDKLEEAIEQLIQICENHDKLDQVLIQSARYHNVKRKLANGMISQSEVDQELNSLRHNILDFIRNEMLITDKAIPYSVEDYKNDFALSLTRVKVSQLFLQDYQESLNLSITMIVSLSALKSRKLIVDFIKELESLGLVEKIKIDGKTCWKANQDGISFFKKFDL